MTWTHAQCLDCWERQNPGRGAYVVIGSSREMCCTCGKQTTDGIYIRMDPAQVKFLQLVIPGTEDL